MNGLVCTCGTGSTGMPQAEIEQRLAPRFDMSTGDIHVLLDLLTDTLAEVLDVPYEERAENETARRMALRAGASVAWMTEFIETWERVSSEVLRDMGR